MILEQIKAHVEEAARQSKIAAAAQAAEKMAKRCADALIENLEEGERKIHDEWFAKFQKKQEAAG